MALDDIKKAILAEAEAEVKTIEEQGNAKIAEINDAWAKKIEIKKQEIIASGQRKANQKVQQTQFKLQAQAQAEILSQKQKIIEKVYKLALEKLSEISDEQYIKLMEKLISQLPSGAGQLISVKNKSSLLKKALRQTGKKYDIAKEEINGYGGFLFSSVEIEIDNTFASLIKSAKEQNILQVSNLLFTKQE